MLAFFGDGATSKGDFHEGLNFAAVFKAPIVYVCQNNQYAISVPLDRQTASESIAVKAEAYGIEGLRIDGNDLLTVYRTVRQAVEEVRAGRGPTLIEAVTYRIAPHSTADDPTRYRHQAEVDKRRQHDPITRCRKILEQIGMWDEEREKALWKKCVQQVALKVEEDEKTHPPHPHTIGCTRQNELYSIPTGKCRQRGRIF